MSDDRDKVEYARKMEKYKIERNAWLATGIVFIILFALSIGAIYFLSEYINQLCGKLYYIVNTIDAVARIFGLSFANDPCPNIIANWP